MKRTLERRRTESKAAGIDYSFEEFCSRGQRQEAGAARGNGSKAFCYVFAKEGHWYVCVLIETI